MGAMRCRLVRRVLRRVFRLRVLLSLWGGKGVFQDTSMLKPPAGAKVAIYEFDDLECPACAHALPIVHAGGGLARFRWCIGIFR